MKYRFFPVMLDGVKIGVAQIENGRLNINIQNGLYRDIVIGDTLTHVSVAIVDENTTNLTIHNEG